MTTIQELVTMRAVAQASKALVVGTLNMYVGKILTNDESQTFEC